MEINYTTGDATQPTGAGPKIIVHICNDIGGWGRGFVVAISNRWSTPSSVIVLGIVVKRSCRLRSEKFNSYKSLKTPGSQI